MPFDSFFSSVHFKLEDILTIRSPESDIKDEMKSIFDFIVRPLKTDIP